MNNPLGLKPHHITARVRDVATVVAWYRDHLGLQAVDQGERFNGAMKFATLGMPGYAISFVQLDAPSVPAPAGVGVVPSWVHPVFSVADPDKLYRELSAKGVRVATHGPKPAQVRTFLFYDCEGNELEIVPEGT